MRVNEIFYSIQGEGYNTGKPAIFVRLSGCNLKCPFCDTDHQPSKGMTYDEIIREILDYPSDLVVLTGGEPTLQGIEELIQKIHQIGKSVAIETNGTQPIPRGVDWITVSPKAAFVGERGKPVIDFAMEVKVIFDGVHEPDDFGIVAPHYYLQPCDTGDEEKNREIIKQLIEYVKGNPKWKISLQTQKMLNVR